MKFFLIFQENKQIRNAFWSGTCFQDDVYYLRLEVTKKCVLRKKTYIKGVWIFNTKWDYFYKKKKLFVSLLNNWKTALRPYIYKIMIILSDIGIFVSKKKKIIFYFKFYFAVNYFGKTRKTGCI